MSLLKTKQIKLNAQGDLIVAGSEGTGTNLAKGSANQVLTSTSNTVGYSYVDGLRDASTGEEVVSVTGGTGSAGENLVISTTDHQVTITAQNTSHTGNVDVVIMPQGNGQVYIGNSGTSVVQGEANEDLTILGGAATVTNANGSNLVLGGGAGNGTGSNGLVVSQTGYTTLLSSAPDEAFVTKGYLTNQVNLIAATEKQEDTINASGTISNFTFNLSFVPLGDVEILFNGMGLEKASYTITGPSLQTVILKDSEIGYSVQNGDIITARYLRSAA